MHDALEILLSFALQTAVAFLVIQRDERSLGERELARAWPPASRASAIVGFGGVVALPLHFLRTRRNFAGVGLAVLAFVGIVLLNVALDLVLGFLFGVG